MKRFKLLSWLLFFALLLVCAVNLYFYHIQTSEAQRQRVRRIGNMADVYNEEFNTMGLLVRYLEDNPLVSELRYEQKSNPQLTDKYKSLMNALKLIETSHLRDMEVYVYFHNMDAIVTSNGKMLTPIAWDKFGLGSIIEPEELCQDKSKEIQIYPRAPVYFETNYTTKRQSGWGTMYVYTQDYVSIIAISYNDSLLAAINTAMLT